VRRHPFRLLVGALVMTACGATGVELPARLVVAPDAAMLARGDSVRLEVAVLAADGAVLGDVGVTFSSDDTTIGRVSETGVVHAAQIGSASVTVEGGGLSVAVPITVIPPPAGLDLMPGDTTLQQGRSVQLVVAVFDSGGAEVSGVTVHFSSDAPSVVSVTPAGVARAEAAAGSALVTARAGSAAATAVVRAVDTAIVARIKLPGPAQGATALGNGTAFVTLPGARQVAQLSLEALALVRLIEVGDGPVRVTPHPALTRVYVSNEGDQTIGVVDLVAGLAVDTFAVTGDPVPLRVNAGGVALFVATDAHRLYRLDATTGEARDSLDLPSTSHFMEFNRGRDRLYVATRVAGTVIEIDAASMTAQRTIDVGGLTQGLVVTADGAELWVANGSGGIDVMSLASGARLAGIPTGALAGVFGLCADAGDIHVYATVPANGQLLIIDRATRSTTRTLTTGGIPREVAFDAATGYVVVANEAGWVDILR
jgi:DNA-binding beta-propeller fold protein YncE